MLNRLVEIGSLEEAHILRNESGSRTGPLHNPDFYNFHLRLLNNILTTYTDGSGGLRFVEQIKRLQQKYNINDDFQLPERYQQSKSQPADQPSEFVTQEFPELGTKIHYIKGAAFVLF